MDKHGTQRISLFFFVFLGALKAPRSSMASFSHYPNERPSAGTGLTSQRKIVTNPSRHREVQPERIVSPWWSWNLEWSCVTWQAATVGTWRLGCCAVHFKRQSLKSARAISSQYFTCKGGRKKERRSPMLLLRQGGRQTGPPSSEGESPRLGRWGRRLVLSS